MSKAKQAARQNIRNQQHMFRAWHNEYRHGAQVGRVLTAAQEHNQRNPGIPVPTPLAISIFIGLDS